MVRIHQFKWVLFAAFLGFILWRVITVNITQHVSRLELPEAKSWHVETNDILLSEANDILFTDPDKAYDLAMKAALREPTDGRALMLIIRVFERYGNSDKAEKLITYVDKLNPRKPDIQLSIGGYWGRQGNLKKAIAAWDVAMQTQPVLSKKIFPELLPIIEQPANYTFFRDAFSKEGQWRDDFFIYAARNATSINTINVLYTMRSVSKTPPTDRMRQAYLDRLFGENRWTDGFFVWMNSLNDKQLSVLGNVYDGGFEVESLEEGYAWRYAKGDGISIVPEQTAGASGAQALHISFLGTQKVKPVIMSQKLLLDARTYEITARVRLDNFSALNGAHWEINCLGTSKALLMKSNGFIVKTPWKKFSQTFEVPENCPAQELKLLIDPVDAKRSNLTGSMWLDDIAITF
jgi:tetratricopeptide (TPR) repeat protein